MTTKTSTRRDTLRAHIRPVARTSISDDIVAQIMGLIASGDLPPGSRLPSERELCKKFGAGRSSLREALRCLAILGVLNARVGEGTSVARDGGKFLGKIFEWRLITGQHDIQNLMEVRLVLETLSASNVAQRRSEQELHTLAGLLDRMKLATARPRRFAQLDLDFHVALARASGNTLLFDLTCMIRGQLALAFSRVLNTPEAMPRSVEEHERILDAISRRDAAAAAAAMQIHLATSIERFRSTLPPTPEISTPEAGTPPKSRKPSTPPRSPRRPRS